jgi:hypothetical protein
MSLDQQRRQHPGFSFIANVLSGRDLITQDPNIEDEIRGQAQSLSAQAQAVRFSPIRSQRFTEPMEQAVFVGAIQTQGLASSMNDNSTHLKVATNNMFFISIFFSVIGAYYALITASSLETNLNEVRSLLGSKTEQELRDIHQLPLSNVAGRFVGHQCSQRTPPIVLLTQDAQSAGDQSGMLAGTTFGNLCSSVEKNKFAGQISAVIIALAFGTCLAAFLLLAYATQPLTVRITTIVVVGALLLQPVVVKYKDDLM